jgi:hypothetical protein
MNEDGGAQDTVDVTRIVPKEDTTERCESADKVGLPGDGSFDAVDIVSGAEGDRARAGLAMGFLAFGSHIGGRL